MRCGAVRIAQESRLPYLITSTPAPPGRVRDSGDERHEVASPMQTRLGPGGGLQGGRVCPRRPHRRVLLVRPHVLSVADFDLCDVEHLRRTWYECETIIFLKHL